MKVGWKTEREVAVQCVRAAGRVLLDWQGKFSVKKKGPNDVVTEADHAAQETIRKILERRFPGDEFLGEEGGPTSPSASKPRRRWIVDPLDGTSNYVHRFPFFCSSVAFEVDGELVAGAVFDPNQNECFSASAGGGADCNGIPISVSSESHPDDALICAGLPAEAGRHPTALPTFVEMSKNAWAVRRLGSAALAMAYVAAGRFDAFWAHQVQIWDVGAAAVMVREAGGLATHFDQSTYRDGRGDILASNGLIHEALRRML